MTPQIVRFAPLLLGNLLGWNSGDPLTRPVVPGPVSVEFQRDTLLLEIGVIAGDQNQIFGNIRDVEVDGDGNILILDDQDFSLSWFGPDGRFRGRTGRDGGGPGEFRAPAGLAVSPAGQIYVLDAASRKVVEFALGEEGLEFVRSLPVPVQGSDMCLIDGRLVVLGQVSDGAPKVYILSEEGEVIRSFGPGFPRQLPPRGLERFTAFFASSNGRGYVHCSGGDVLAIASERLGIVRWFSTQGDFIREVAINEFSPVTWTPNPGGGLSMGVDPATGVANTLSHLSGGGPGQIVATIHTASMEDMEGRLDIYVLDSESGEQSSPIPSEAVASAFAHHRLYSFVRDPYPKVLVQTIPQWLRRH